MYNAEEEKIIKDIIEKQNLYPTETKAYVELFSCGSSFFWGKDISFVEFINDINGEINFFLESIRNFDLFLQKYKDTIYSNYEEIPECYNDIINSNFYKRLNITYIMRRKYSDLINVTDSENTFYYCECSLDEEIFEKLSNVSGKYLIIDKNKENLLRFKNEKNNIHIDEFAFLFNYNNEKNKNLLF